MSLTADQRRALVLLATTQRMQRGATEALMLANDFECDMLAGLVRAGLATVTAETMLAGITVSVIASRTQGVPLSRLKKVSTQSGSMFNGGCVSGLLPGMPTTLKSSTTTEEHYDQESVQKHKACRSGCVRT